MFYPYFQLHVRLAVVQYLFIPRNVPVNHSQTCGTAVSNDDCNGDDDDDDDDESPENAAGGMTDMENDGPKQQGVENARPGK